MCGVDDARANSNYADHGDLLEHFTSPNLCALDQRTLHIFGSVLMLRRKIRDWRRQGRSDRNHDRALAIWAPYFAFSVCRAKMLTTDMTPESNLHRRLPPPSPTGYSPIFAVFKRRDLITKRRDPQRQNGLGDIASLLL